MEGFGVRPDPKMTSLAMVNMEREIKIQIDQGILSGILSIPKDAKGIVLFVHGSGSSRHSPRNQSVARKIFEGGMGTFLFDLLTEEEEEEDNITGELRFNIPMLAERTVLVTKWIETQKELKGMKIGYFGASTGAAAALIAAASLPTISAIVSRGGRPDLALDILSKVKAPTLLMVGGEDTVVLEMNKKAYEKLLCEKKLLIIPGATHLFEEKGKLEEVAKQAVAWFKRLL